MKAYWDHRIQELRGVLLRMGALSLQNLREANEALCARDPVLATRVEEADAGVDALEKQVDELVVGFVSTHSPAAVDCRFFLMGMKIGKELEEIADQATTIARRARALSGESSVEWPAPVYAFLDRVAEAVAESLRCFEERDPGLARKVVEADDATDAAYAECAREVQGMLVREPGRVRACLDMLTVLKALERAADRAVNIAEDVVYLHEGEDIRHTAPGDAQV